MPSSQPSEGYDASVDSVTDNDTSPFPWHLGVFDAHCHPTDTVDSLNAIPKMKAKVLTIMATRLQDQHLVTDFADRVAMTPRKASKIRRKDLSDGTSYVIPSFGWHPWFSYQVLDDQSAASAPTMAEAKVEHYKSVLTPEPHEGFIHGLPNPRPLSADIAETRKCLERFPMALVGEVGLDRSFRLPVHWCNDRDSRDQSLTPGGREGRRLSPYRVSLDHQRKILKAQLNLAGEMQRAVSVHGVAAHGVLFETLQETWKGHEKAASKRAAKRYRDAPMAREGEEGADREQEPATSIPSSFPFPPRVCLHSFSGPVNILQQYLHSSIPTMVFFSFSHVINFSPPTFKIVEVIEAVPDDRLLVESDLHCAGERMDDLLEQMIREICKIKKWHLEDGIKQLGTNWILFALGPSED